MKTYSIDLSVPDDFNPEELSIELGYKEDIEIVNEGFFPEHFKSLIDKVEVIKEEITPTSVIFFKFPPELVNYPNLIRSTQALIGQATGGCTTIGILNDIDILAQNSAESIDMLKKIIDKINLKSSIKIAL